MWIICCGMRRGGSTVHAQITADIASQDRIRLITPESFPLLEEECKNKKGTFVVKCHRFVEESEKLLRSGEAKVIYIFRDIRDVVVSYMNKYNESFYDVLNKGFINGVLFEYSKWTSLNEALISKYETMIVDMEMEVHRIAEYLSVDIDDIKAHKIADKYSISEQKKRIKSFDYRSFGHGDIRNRFNPKTLLHDNHIFSGEEGQWKNRLSSFQVGFIEKLAFNFFLIRNYKLSQPWFIRNSAWIYFSFIYPFVIRMNRVRQSIMGGTFTKKK